YVSQPQQEASAATAGYTAGSLFIRWQPPSSSNVFLIALGGARVSVAALPGSDFTLPTTPTAPSFKPPAVAASTPPSRPGITSTAPTAAPPSAAKPAPPTSLTT